MAKLRLWGALFLLFAFVTHDLWAATLSTKGTPLCGYGQYNLKGKCTSYNIQAEECPQIDGRPSYLVSTYQATFSPTDKKASDPCLADSGPVGYDPTLIYLVSSGRIGLAGNPLCGYGQYKLDGVCYDRNSDEIQGRCGDGAYKTTVNQGTYIQYIEGAQCSAGWSVFDYNFATDATGDAVIIFKYNGVIGLYGAPLGTGVSFDRSTPCHDTLGSKYYKLDFSAFDSEIFAFPIDGKCASGYSKYIVQNDCKNIDINSTSTTDKNSSANQANQICAILCPDDSLGAYTNSGTCSNYCNTNGKDLRVHFTRSDGTIGSWPLYTTATTTPAMNFDINGMRCHANMYEFEIPNTIKTLFNQKTYSIGD